MLNILAVAAAFLAASPARAADVRILRSAVCTAVVNHEPSGALTGPAFEYPSDVDRVLFWFEAAAENIPQTVKVSWLFEGREEMTGDLHIRSAYARTWSNKKVRPGRWRVEARDASGAVLAVVDFKIAGDAPAYAAFAHLYGRLMAGETAAQLEDALPHLVRNLKTAAEVSERHWAECTPYDELAKADILPGKALRALGIPRAVTLGVAHAPAGLMHTYGYLFSQLRTPYGLKGKRWIESRLDERLGLPAKTFDPLTSRGEFASNLTSVLLQLIGAPENLPHAAPLTPVARVSGSVEQRVTWKTPDGKTVSASVFTRLVPLAPLPGLKTNDTDLLIYEVVRDGRHLLVTAFPIEKTFADSIRDAKPETSAAFKPRFNFYVDPSWTVVAQENTGYLPRVGS